MTMNDRTSRGLGRPPLALVVIMLVIVAVVGAWSYFWMTASSRADEAFTAWLAVEAAQGRVHSCADRRTGGYPFRFEMVCEGPSLMLVAEPEVVATGEAIRAVMQVWRPDHVIVEVDGPVRVTPGPDLLPETGPLVAEWDLLQASLRVPFGELAAVDVVSDGFSLRPEAGEGEPGFALEARHVELHQRDASGLDARDGMDLALSAQDLLVSFPGSSAAEPVDVTLRGSAVALTPEILAHPRNFLPRWQEAGGSLSIEAFRATQDESSLHAQGNLRPEPEGRIAGELTLAVTGPDVASPGTTEAFGGVVPLLATALQFVGERTEIEGQPAVQGTLSLRDGKAFIGNFPIADLPALY